MCFNPDGPTPYQPTPAEQQAAADAADPVKQQAKLTEIARQRAANLRLQTGRASLRTDSTGIGLINPNSGIGQ
jgi:hypothetical protein